MSQYKLTILCDDTDNKNPSINIEVDSEMDIETVGNILVEALWAFLTDVREWISSEQVELYNEYVASLHGRVKKALIHSYKDAKGLGPQDT